MMLGAESYSRGSHEKKSLTKSIQMSMVSNELTRLRQYQGNDHVLAKNWRDLHDTVSHIHRAAFNGSLESIKRFIKDQRGRSRSTADVNILTEDGPKLLKEPMPSDGEFYGKENYVGFFLNTTPLMMAAQQGHHSVVKYLVEHCHADVNACDSLGITAVSFACSFNRRDVVKYLLIKHANINVAESQNGMTPIILACVNNHTDMLEVLLSHHAKVHIADKFGRQAMHYAAWNYNWRAVELLYHHDNKSINYQDNERNTPLHLLVTDENVDDVVNNVNTLKHDHHFYDILSQLAKRNGTTIDIKRESKRGANHLGEDLECLVRMINLGASVNIRNDKGQTPLYMLCNRLTPVIYSSGYLYIDEPTTTQNLLVMLVILLKCGCSVNGSDFQGRTPLSLCVERKNWLAASILGAHTEIKSKLSVDGLINLEDAVGIFEWDKLFEYEQTKSELEYMVYAVMSLQRDSHVQKMAKRILCKHVK